jgi:hypothetical protein
MLLLHTHSDILRSALFFSVNKKMNTRKLLKNRLALSTVVTTLIILVVSVLLAGVVTYYAINVTSTRVSEESLQLEFMHVWYNPTSSTTQAAFAIINTGGRDVVLQKITVRGQPASWGNVFYGVVGAGTTVSDLSYLSGTVSGQTLDGSTLAAATASTTLPSGDTMVVYISSPDSISINDIGLTVSITVFTSQAMYYEEANVQTTQAAA